MAALPSRMRAVEITRPGGPEVLALAERPVPAPAAGEVLIRVAAAGVNRPDCLQRRGVYPPPPGASDLPGLEIAGTVAAVGAGVTRWKEGDAACALLAGGGYAEYAAAPAAQCLPVPKGLTPIEAATFPEAVFTVWVNVFERARLAAGESFLVQGGTSGIGVFAIQMAAALGSKVFATAGTPEKVAACEGLGAARGIDYKKEDFAAVVRDATGGRGVDVVLDMVGGDYLDRELACMAEDGRLSLIAFLGGPRSEITLPVLMMKRLTVTGSTLRARRPEVKAAIARAVEEKIWPLVEAGKIRPVIDSTFPLARAADAHTRMESGAHIGKIALYVQG